MSATSRTLAAVLAVAVPIAAQASPAALTAAEVRDLVTRPDCGGVSDATPEGVALREHLVAKVTHESGRNPYAIRVEDERRALPPIPTKDAAVREAMWRLEAGMTLGLGLGQITHKDNLARDFGVRDWREAVPLAFEPCPQVRAIVRHFAGDIERAAKVLDCASGAYNRGVVACGTGYARSIAAIRDALPADLMGRRRAPLLPVDLRSRDAAPARPAAPPSPAPASRRIAVADMALRLPRPAPASPPLQPAAPGEGGHQEIASR